KAATSSRPYELTDGIGGNLPLSRRGNKEIIRTLRAAGRETRRLDIRLFKIGRMRPIQWTHDRTGSAGPAGRSPRAHVATCAQRGRIARSASKPKEARPAALRAGLRPPVMAPPRRLAERVANGA